MHEQAPTYRGGEDVFRNLFNVQGNLEQYLKYFYKSKTTMKYHLTPIRMAIIKKKKIYKQ